MTDTTTTAERRIYVADLSSYNNGVLHGVWIDADQDANDIEAEVRAMLRESKYPNVTVPCPDCDGTGGGTIEPDDGETAPQVGPCETCKGAGTVPSAEEWAIHDHEGFGELIGESTSFEDVAELAAALEEHGDAFRIWLENGNDMDSNAVEAFQEAYAGEWRSEREFAENLLDDIGELKDNSLASRYFDYDAFARDLFMSDYWYEDGHVFRNL